MNSNAGNQGNAFLINGCVMGNLTAVTGVMSLLKIASQRGHRHHRRVKALDAARLISVYQMHGCVTRAKIA